MILILLLIIPLMGGGLLALCGHKKGAAELSIIISGLTFIISLVLAWQIIQNGTLEMGHEWFEVDALNIFLVLLTTFIGLNTTIFSRSYMHIEQLHHHVTSNRLRLFHSMYHVFIFTLLLALVTNNFGILWVALEAATLSTVLLISLYRTPAALEAAWKYFILCGVGITQALFGTVLLYFAAEKVLGAGGTALLWTHLNTVKHLLQPDILRIAFVFLLIGYGTKAGLVPLHNWLPDAHAEGPTPLSAVLSGLLLNVAVYAIIRSKILVDGALNTHLAGHLMMGFGIVSVLVAAFFLLRQKELKRLFAYSSIEHIGLITFALGMGGPIANFAAFLHMTAHALTKSAIFYTVGHAFQKTGTQLMTHIRGLLQLSPALGWGLLFGSLAILGMPPFGLFASEFLILMSAVHQALWAIPLLLFALGVAFTAIWNHVQPMLWGEVGDSFMSQQPKMIVVFVHLGIVLILGLFIPSILVIWYQHAAQLLSY